MITKDNFKDLLTKLGFSSSGDTFTKKLENTPTETKSLGGNFGKG